MRIRQPAFHGNGVELPAQRVEVPDGHLVGRVARVAELAVCVQERAAVVVGIADLAGPWQKAADAAAALMDRKMRGKAVLEVSS
jgi:hypothetical protein